MKSSVMQLMKYALTQEEDRRMVHFAFEGIRLKVLRSILLICLLGLPAMEVLAQCNADITSNLSPNIEGCGPLTVQFSSGTSTGIITGINWQFGDGDSATSNNPVHTYLPGSVDTNYIVILSITCVSGSSTITDTVTVFAPPVVSFTTDTNTVCALSDSICFTNLSDAGLGYIYAWNFGDFNVSSVFEPCHIYTADGFKDVTLAVTNNKGCFRDTTIVNLIEVIAAPNPQFDVDPLFGCHPQDIVFTNTTVDSTSIASWLWDWGDGTPTNNSQQPSSHTFLNYDTLIITLSATNLLGCSNSSQRALVVFETPTATFTSDSVVCADESLQITYTGTADSTAIYNWDFDGGLGFPGSGQGPQYVQWSTPGTKTITLEVIRDSCSSTYSSNILVNALPTINILSSATSNISCFGQSVLFTSSPAGYLSYAFYVNGSVVQDSTINTFESSSLNNGDLITVEITDANGCTSDTSNTIDIMMTINPLPAITLTSSIPNDSICIGDSVDFSVSPDSLIDYSFYRGFLLLQSGALSTYSTSSLQDGDTLFVIATDSLGCTSVASNTVYMNVSQPLSAPQVNCGSSSLAPDSIQFTWDSIPGAIGYEITADSGLTYITPSGGLLGLYHWVVGVDSVEVTVRALGADPCGNSPLSSAVTCYAFPCDAITFSKSSDPTVCSGDTVALSISTISATPFSVIWNGDTSNISVDTTFTYVAQNDSVISVMVIDSSQLLCPFPTKSFNITVKSLPSVILTSDFDSICSGSSVIYTASPAGFDNYAFYNDTSYLHDSTYHIYTVSGPSQGDSVFIVTTQDGCIDTSNRAGVHIVPLPNIIFSSSLFTDTICTGDTVSFSVDTGLAQYSFYLGNTLIQDSLMNTYVTDSMQNGDIIYAIAIDSFGCVSDTSNAIEITVLSNSNVSLVSSDSAICDGDSISFTASPSGLVSYLFYLDSIMVQDSSIESFATVGLVSGNYVSVIAINSNGCASRPIDTIIPVIKPVPSPIVGSLDSILEICNGDSMVLFATPDSLFVNASFAWNTGDTLDTITVNPISDASFYVISTLDACTGSDTVRVVVDSVVPVADAGSNVVICMDTETGSLSASGGITYSWSPSFDLDDPNISNPVASPQQTTTYTVTVTNIACSSTDSVAVVNLCMGIPEIITDNEDGVNDELMIPGIEFFPNNVFSIFNRWGNEVFSTEGYDNQTNNWSGKSSNGKSLPDGTYFYVLDLGIDIEPITGFVMIHR